MMTNVLYLPTSVESEIGDTIKSTKLTFLYEINKISYNWIVYIDKVNKSQFEQYINNKSPAKIYIQSKVKLTFDEIMPAFFQDMPITWCQFLLMNEQELYQISKDLGILNRVEKLIPDAEYIFKPLYSCEPKNVKLILFGHLPCPESDGLAFSSTNSTTNVLDSIYSELERENFSPTRDSSLVKWAEQGVLLCNMSWTAVQDVKILSQWELWKNFTCSLVKFLIQVRKDRLVIAFTSLEAHTKLKFAAAGCRHVFYTSSPLPPECNKKPKFVGSNIFLKINAAIKDFNDEPINW